MWYDFPDVPLPRDSNGDPFQPASDSGWDWQGIGNWVLDLGGLVVSFLGLTDKNAAVAAAAGQTQPILIAQNKNSMWLIIGLGVLLLVALGKR